MAARDLRELMPSTFGSPTCQGMTQPIDFVLLAPMVFGSQPPF
jgi:hypothetical protein